MGETLMAKGKGKGSEFERTICKELSLWWTEGERDDVFWRSATSGARAKTRTKVGKTTFGQYGDIQATDPIGQPLISLMTIECKRGYGNASIADVLDKGKKSAQQSWENWLEQTLEDKENAGAPFWMMITKRDRREPVIFIPSTFYRKLRMEACPIHEAERLVRITIPKIPKFEEKRITIYGTLFSEFMRLVSPDNIKSIKEEME